VIGHGAKFGRKKEQAIAALLSQRTTEDAARTIGVGPATLLRWLKEKEFDAAYRAARRAAFSQSIARLQQASSAKWQTPIFLCPVGGQKAYNPEGEVAVARAARAKKTMQILSTATASSVEDVAAGLGTPPWYQLYMPASWSATEKLVRRVEDAGCPTLVWTIDLVGGRNLETFERLSRTDTRACSTCHGPGPGLAHPRPMTDPLPRGGTDSRLPTWDSLDRLKKMTKMKVLVKGLDSADDARLALGHGADGIVVSNHGGRSTETLRATIDALPEVVEAVGGRIPVLVDGGFRRGTDIYKAMALGASAVGIGRPYIYGLGSFGQEGVERVLDILQAELRLTMRQCGTPTVRQITRSYVARSSGNP
jgi:isopentenyl diphosphate isomerase/L-lactate dehydrogenase-like FMN-dependent dehydrogenase